MTTRHAATQDERSVRTVQAADCSIIDIIDAQNRQTPVDSNTRLRIATRIHFALLRHLGDTVDVGDILHRESQTREVLWVCEGSGDDELMTLAKQFREALAAEHLAAMRAQAPVLSGPLSIPLPNAAPPSNGPDSRTPPDSAWHADSSGFGVSGPGGLAKAPSARSRFDPRRWLLRGPRSDG